MRGSRSRAGASYCAIQPPSGDTSNREPPEPSVGSAADRPHGVPTLERRRRSGLMALPGTNPPDLAPFLPQLLRTWLTDDAAGAQRVVDGTLAIMDISGFTQLTERLAARGRVGAEELTEILDAIFSE